MPAAGTGTLDIAEDTKYHRHSTDRAFLPAKLARERQAHLKICTDSLVTRVELVTEGEDVRATGVHFEATNSRKAWKRYFAKARREVVLCGGALGSPQVLMLRWDRSIYPCEHLELTPHVAYSGLGPKEHLESRGISVIRDLPAIGSYLVCRSLLSLSNNTNSVYSKITSVSH